MALGDYIKGVPKPTTYNSLVNSPTPSSGTPLIAPKAPSQSSYSSAPAPYIAPVQNYQPAYSAPAKTYQAAPSNTASYGIGAPTSGGYGGAPAPAPQSKPVISESDWLAGDSEYQNQLGQYDTALSDFLSRLATQRSDFTTDYNTAVTGLGRNKDRSLLSNGEDFTSRGLANSGLFAKATGDLETAFKTQENGLNTARDRANADFQNQENDKRKSTEQAKGNAKLSSLGRMSMAQSF